MKVICVGWNYPAHNQELSAPVPNEPTIFCKPDSALLKQNKPFYVPDFMGQIDYELEVVIRINRLGKGIAEKFASRYYTEVGLGTSAPRIFHTFRLCSSSARIRKSNAPCCFATSCSRFIFSSTSSFLPSTVKIR